MNAADPQHFGQVEIAQSEVYSWRGRYLAIFARGEEVISRTLVSLNDCCDGKAKPKLLHLPSQRSDALGKALPHLTLTKKQQDGVSASLLAWRKLESTRNFVVHGSQKVALDSQGHWVCILDMTVMRANSATHDRLTICKDEGLKLIVELERTYQMLSTSLGMLRSVAERA